MKDWLDILETCDLQNWKEALAAVMTYAKPEEFSSLCGESSGSLLYAIWIFGIWNILIFSVF